MDTLPTDVYQTADTHGSVLSISLSLPSVARTVEFLAEMKEKGRNWLVHPAVLFPFMPI